MSIEHEYGKYVPTCDNCGDFLDPEDSFEEARIAMKEKNWATKKVDDYWVNLCARCKEEKV